MRCMCQQRGGKNSGPQIRKPGRRSLAVSQQPTMGKNMWRLFLGFLLPRL